LPFEDKDICLSMFGHVARYALNSTSISGKEFR